MASPACRFNDDACVRGDCLVCNPRPVPPLGVAEKRARLTAMLADPAYAHPDDQAVIGAALADLPSA